MAYANGVDKEDVTILHWIKTDNRIKPTPPNGMRCLVSATKLLNKVSVSNNKTKIKLNSTSLLT
jgi:hypothetical protein